MPCYYPLQAIYTVLPNGKKEIEFSTPGAKLFAQGVSRLGDSSFSIPCGKCMGCRLERSRQWAMRCVHEASLYEDNCFITLTFDDKHLKEQCPLKSGGYSLVKKHMQDFMKRLRQKYKGTTEVITDDGESIFPIRYFYCGEYGGKSGRPHYHAILFNLDFKDRVFWKTQNSQRYDSSLSLSELWPFGFVVVGDVSFESAAYVARYCTKKVTGSRADDHYGGRLPEFCQASLKPGIGTGWIKKYGKSDVFPFDDCVVKRGDGYAHSKPPRFYDKYLEKNDPDSFQKIKEARLERAEDNADDNTFRRLLVREKCQQARMKRLIRSLDFD